VMLHSLNPKLKQKTNKPMIVVYNNMWYSIPFEG